MPLTVGQSVCLCVCVWRRGGAAPSRAPEPAPPFYKRRSRVCGVLSKHAHTHTHTDTHTYTHGQTHTRRLKVDGIPKVCVCVCVCVCVK